MEIHTSTDRANLGWLGAASLAQAKPSPSPTKSDRDSDHMRGGLLKKAAENAAATALYPYESGTPKGKKAKFTPLEQQQPTGPTLVPIPGQNGRPQSQTATANGEILATQSSSNPFQAFAVETVAALANLIVSNPVKNNPLGSLVAESGSELAKAGITLGLLALSVSPLATL